MSKSFANSTISVLVGSVMASSPLPIAPTGLMRSWHTNEHIMAAKSDAPISITLAMVLSPFRGGTESHWPTLPTAPSRTTPDTAAHRLIPAFTQLWRRQRHARLRAWLQALPGLSRPPEACRHARGERLAIAHRIEQEQRIPMDRGNLRIAPAQIAARQRHGVVTPELRGIGGRRFGKRIAIGL